MGLDIWKLGPLIIQNIVGDPKSVVVGTLTVPLVAGFVQPPRVGCLGALDDEVVLLCASDHPPETDLPYFLTLTQYPQVPAYC